MTYEDILESELEVADPFVLMNSEFDHFEQQLLLDQTTTIIYSQIKRELINMFESVAYKEAAVFILLMLFKGHEASNSWLEETWGIEKPDELRKAVVGTMREVMRKHIHEQAP